MTHLSFGAYGVAAVVATAGLWWFAHILRDLKRAEPLIRYGLYAAVWFAYFGLVVILASRAGPS
ncbi:MAG TPA: hypothetical protein VNH64_12400 [Parvularculaceae bacterium]|nr:hypothetical protein [Parvularculaceae bacterium]